MRNTKKGSPGPFHISAVAVALSWFSAPAASAATTVLRKRAAAAAAAVVGRPPVFHM